jgi:hypothetical protein
MADFKARVPFVIPIAIVRTAAIIAAAFAAEFGAKVLD